MSTNPLKAYARAPKIYVKLPTVGKFYEKGLIEVSATNDVAVRAMTARDDMLMSNPDALLNGDAVFKSIESCVGITDSSKLLVPDVEVLLLAIRYASKGDTLTFNTKCPACGNVSSEKISIRNLLETVVTLDDVEEEPFYEMVNDENNKIRINITASPYTDITATNVVVYEQARLLQYLGVNTHIDREEREELIKKSYNDVADLQYQILLNSIDSIDIINGQDDSEVITKVTKKEFIAEFLNDLSSDDAVAINKKIEFLNSVGLPETLTVRCEAVTDEKEGTHCGHEYEMEVKFDPSNFSEDTFSV